MLNEPCQQVITGIGLVTPAGVSVVSVVDALRHGRSGIAEARSFDCDALRTRYFAEVSEIDTSALLSPAEARRYDKATRMAAVACASALADADLGVPDRALARAALCIGISGGGPLQTLRFAPDGRFVPSRTAAVYSARNVPHFQGATLSRLFGIGGPLTTFCNASASGAVALAYALTLLRRQRVEVAIVGGSEALTMLNVVGLDSLHMTAPSPCAPFSTSDGMTFGEGAAFLVVENRGHAQARGARVLVDVLGVRVTSDGYDVIGNDPAGRGLCAAYRGVLADAELGADQVGWIKASATGSRAQDRAESLALTEIHGSPEKVPPVACFEPIFGHPNGAAPLLGIAAAAACLSRSLLPPPQPFAASHAQRPSGELAAAARAQAVVCNAMGFGGSNAVALLGRAGQLNAPRRATAARIAIIGAGAVSPFGKGLDALRAGLLGGAAPFVYDEVGARQERRAVARVPAAAAGEDRASSSMRKRARLRQFALTAAREALQRAGVVPARDPAATAVVVAMAHGPVAVQEALLEQVGKGRNQATLGRMLLDMSRFAVVSDVCREFGARGFSTSLSGGIGVGLDALACAAEVLSADATLKHALVIAVDETTRLHLELIASLGLLARLDTGGAGFAPYCPASSGLVVGEGAVALVLERQSEAEPLTPAAYCEIAGTGFNNDAAGFGRARADGAGLSRAIEDALSRAGKRPEQIDAVYGNGRGLPAEDARELAALRRVFSGPYRPRLTAVSAQLGVAPASSGLFAAAACALGMKEGRVFPLLSRGELMADDGFVRGEACVGDFRRTLVVSSCEGGGNTALLLERPAA